jgi:uncharacterized protein YbcV (DUF1398 family)
MQNQPLDALMIRLGISNADLVHASTEQLSFKMVQKGRSGEREISPNIQEKVLRALQKLKPELAQLKSRELFHYPMNEASKKAIESALAQIGKKKIKYPRFIDLLLEAGVLFYNVDVAAGRVTFYGPYNQAHVEQSPGTSSGPAGAYDEEALKKAIADAQKEFIDHPTFLQRAHAAGILTYEVNLRKRRIVYQGQSMAYKEWIPASTPEPVKAVPAAPALAIPKKKKSAPAKKKSTGVRNSLKGRKAKRKRKGRGR